MCLGKFCRNMELQYLDTRGAKLGKIQGGGLQKASQDSTKGGLQ